MLLVLCHDKALKEKCAGVTKKNLKLDTERLRQGWYKGKGILVANLCASDRHIRISVYVLCAYALKTRQILL